MPEVACLGDLNLDVLMYMDRLPDVDSEALASRVELSPGGAAANVAVALSRLGVSSGFIGAVGNDIVGRMLRQDLHDEGVDTSLLATVAGDSSGLMVIVVTSGGKRTILGYRGANRELGPECLDEAYLKQLKLLFVSGYAFLEPPQRDAAIHAVKVARAAGVAVAVDVSEPLAAMGLDRVSKVIGPVDYAFMNEREAGLLLSGASEDDALSWARVFVVKMGDRGARASSEATRESLPAFRVEAIDTTGAGDAFDAGFIYAALRGLGLRECLVVANAVAAWKCTGRGSRYLPTLDELREFLASRGYGELAEGLA